RIQSGASNLSIRFRSPGTRRVSRSQRRTISFASGSFIRPCEAGARRIIAMSSDHDDETKDHFERTLDQAQGPVISTSLVEVEFAALTDRGKVRATNDDQYFVGRADRVLEPLLMTLPGECAPVRFGETAYGMLVADGVGGTEAGREVSLMAISTFV